MAKRHVMTARRKVALRKAQLASARKRGKGGSRKRTARRVAARVGILAVLSGGAVGAKKYQPYAFKDHRQGEPRTPRFIAGGGNGVGMEFGRGTRLYGTGLRPKKNFRHVSGGFKDYTK
jgi:hypothetical protein